MASTLSDSADRVFVEVPGDGGVCVAARGRGFCMLNTWTQNAVHRDADRLMDLAPQIADRYCRLDLAAAREKIHADFADAPRRIDEHLCRFSRADFPQFEFSLHIGLSRDRLALSVHGRDRYQGFMLQTVDGQRWYASVSDGITYRAAAEAPTLLAVVEARYEVRNMDRVQAVLVSRFRSSPNLATPANFGIERTLARPAPS